MAMLTVRNIPAEVHRALRVRAAQHGHIMDAEARAGAALLPAGQRRAGLQDSLETRVRHCLPAGCCPSIWAAPKPMQQ